MEEFRRNSQAFFPKAGFRVGNHKKARRRGAGRVILFKASDVADILGIEAVDKLSNLQKRHYGLPVIDRRVDRIVISGVETRPRAQKLERATTPAKPTKARGLPKGASALLSRIEQELTDPQVDLSGVDPDRIIQAVMRLVPHKGPNELATRVGPFYDTNGLVSWLGISRQAINKKVHAGKMVACKTEDRVLLYPTWQFSENGELRPGLDEVLNILWAGTQDGWTIGLWLVTASEQFEGKTAVEWLSEGRDLEVVRQVACRDAAVWAA